ncbi:alpha/beta hydrolase family protein [Glycomyces arizonensis]|uniref:alpha/beta hydrolase family protein n=1 Tax=Glycomyces arizonensis TaxID=256035 RepID=UPI0003FA82F9|nr:alpha/beta hydrolase [Glycomyces arizonensis]
MKRNVKRALLGTTAVAVAATTGAFALTGANAETADAEPIHPPALAIPEPSGPFATGTTALHLVDEGRADPWAPEEDRELMVTMWYPTEEEGESAPYMTAEESALFAVQLEIPPDLLASVETNSVPGAEPLADDGSLPLVVLSPGFSFPRATLTGLAEELASQGYAVAAVGHNYEAPITFPDRTTECLACTTDDYDAIVPNRAEDLSFVLDELTGDDAAWEDAGIVDADRVMVGGHSIGGASSHRVMLADDRFDAGFNLDGTFFGLDRHKLDRPFMMVGAAEHGQPGEDKTWTKAWKHLDGWKRWVTVEDTTHSSFTDFAPLGVQAGMPIQDLDGFYADRLTRAYVTAFADEHLRGEDEPILDGENEDWPEVEFHNP